MQGFGVHSFRMVNEAGESVFVKFHWTPVAGTHSLVWDEAVKISGADPDYHRRDLWERIESGNYPEYELGVADLHRGAGRAVQLRHPRRHQDHPEELVPLRPVGRMVLNRNPDNFFAETEQVAFCTAHVVPGIDFSNDPLLAGRIHSYVDTQITRLGGPNFHEIPINSPIAQVHNNQRDGMHRQAIHRGRVNVRAELAGRRLPVPGRRGAGLRLGAARIRADEEQGKVRAKPEKFADHYTQARLFFESQTPVEQDHIANAFRFELSKVTVPAIRERMVAIAAQCVRGTGEEGGRRPRHGPDAGPAAAGAAEPGHARGDQVAALSLLARPGRRQLKGRKIALLVAPGVEGESIAALQAALAEQGAVGRLVGPRIGPLPTAAGDMLDADASLENEPGFLFDGLVLPDGAEAVAALAQDGHTAGIHQGPVPPLQDHPGAGRLA
jgi:catalase